MSETRGRTFSTMTFEEWKKLTKHVAKPPRGVPAAYTIKEDGEIIDRGLLPPMFVCPTCSKEYKTRGGLKRHVKAKHDGEPKESSPHAMISS